MTAGAVYRRRRVSWPPQQSHSNIGSGSIAEDAKASFAPQRGMSEAPFDAVAGTATLHTPGFLKVRDESLESGHLVRRKLRLSLKRQA
jgi:hypothetical protein